MLMILLACEEPAGKPSSAEAADDTAAGPLPTYTFEGSATLYFSVDDEVRCDLDADLVGAPAAELCPGCEWSLDVTPTVTRNEGTEPCLDDWQYGPAYDQLAFDASYDTYVYTDCDYDDCDGREVTYENTLLSYDNQSRFWRPVAHDRDVTWAGDTFTWSWTRETVQRESTNAFFQLCDGDVTVTDVTASGTAVSGEVATDTLDGWSVALEAGIPFLATAVRDGTDAATLLALNDAEGCTVAYGRTIDCPDTADIDILCQTLAFTPDESGTYTLGVHTMDEGGRYLLTVEGGAGLALAADDVVLMREVTYVMRGSGAGMLTPVE